MNQQAANKNQTAIHPEQASSGWIPNINIGEDYDRRYIDAPIHYESIDNLAVFFGRDMPVHRHAQYFQIYYIEAGDINFHIDDNLFQVKAPPCFLHLQPSLTLSKSLKILTAMFSPSDNQLSGI